MLRTLAGKITALVCTAGLCVLLLCGCSRSAGILSNYREIEQLRLIRVMGIDQLPEGVRVTVSSGEDEGSVLMRQTGASVTQAVNNLQQYASDQELYYGHLAYLLLGEQEARQGLGHAADYAGRSSAIPMGAGLLIVRGGSAEELMLGSGSDEYCISSALRLLERVVLRQGQGRVFSLLEVERSLSEYGGAVALAVQAKSLEGAVEAGEDSAGVTAIADGFAVLRRDRSSSGGVGGQSSAFDGQLVTFIEAEDAACTLMLLEQMDSAALTLRMPEKGAVTAEVESCDIEYLPQWEGTCLTELDLEVNVRARVLEAGSGEALRMSEDKDALCAALSEYLTRSMAAVLDTERTSGVDFLGLRSKLRRLDYRRFDGIQGGWESALRELHFKVSVQSDILEGGELKDYSAGQGGKAHGAE